MKGKVENARRRRTVKFLLVALGFVATACNGSASAASRFAADHSALTMLASTAIRVDLIKVTYVPTTNTSGTGRELKVLQRNYHNLFTGESTDGDPLTDPPELGTFYDGTKVGETYLYFWSYDRSGPCESAVFAYRGTKRPLTLIYGDYSPNVWSGVEPHDGFQLGRHFLPMPKTVTYKVLLRSLYPTGKALFPSNASESTCPGP